MPTISLGVLVCSFLGIIYFQWRKNSGIKYLPLFQVWFSVFGIGIYIFSILILLNTLVTVDVSSSTHAILWESEHRSPTRFSIENEGEYPSSAMKYSNSTISITRYVKPSDDHLVSDSLTLYFKKGLLGFERFTHNRVVYYKSEQIQN